VNPRPHALLLLLAANAAAEPPTREDVARAYLRADAAYRAHRPADPAEVNRAFDRATLKYLRGTPREVVLGLDELTARLRPDGARPPGLSIRPARRRVEAGGSVVFDVVDVARERRRCTLRLHNGAAGPPVRTAAVAPGRRLAFDGLPPGRYDLELEVVDGDTPPAGWAAGSVFVVGPSLEPLRHVHDWAVEHALLPPEQRLALRAPNRLLRSDPADHRSIRLLADPFALAERLATETLSLLLDPARTPYRLRKGGYWRVVRAGRVEIPLRVHAPAAASRGAPVPLVVALHGAGGDENLFVEGYGAGRLRELADEHGFLLFSPLTYPVLAEREAFDALLDAARRCYRVDERRIYVLGHSLGAFAAMRTGTERPDLVAAVACLAGGGARPGGPPTLVVAAELDPILPAQRLRRNTDPKANAVFREVEDRGHTLMVGDVLPDVVAWLLDRRRER